MKQLFSAFLLLTLLSASTVIAQNNTGALLQIDKPFYVSGEILWYKVYLPQQFSGNDRIIRMTLTDDQGKLIHEHYVRNGGRTYVDGYYKIPFDCITGNYLLSFSGVRQEIDMNTELVSVVVPMYNDFETVTVNDPDMLETPTDSPAGSRPSDLQIDIDHVARVSPGDKQHLEIRITDEGGIPVNAHVSVSVVDQEIVPEAGIATGPEIAYGVIEESLENDVFIKGLVHEENGNPVQINVLAAFLPEENRVRYTKSDDAGRFALKMPSFTGQRLLQFTGFQEEISQIRVELSDELDDDSSLPEVSYSPEVLNYLNLSRERKQIYKHFTTLEQAITPEIPAVDVQEFVPDYSFDVGEYEAFDFVRDFFGELITPLKFRRQKNGDTLFTAQLNNPKGRTTAETVLKGKPLFIVDGKMTRDADFIARMEMTPIERIELFYDPIKLRRLFSAIGKSGVVRIVTRLPNLEVPDDDMRNIVTVSGLQAEAEFPGITVSDESRKAPALRPQLFWVPGATTDEEGRISVSYLQSDDITTFRVTILAQDDQGRRGMKTMTYRAEPAR